jgi:hydroxymethylglutaryl-CoA lyase
MAYDPMVHPGPRLPAVGAEQTAVRIYEVAPRDGLQNEREIVTDRRQGRADPSASWPLGPTTDIEVTSFVRPAWIPQLADASRRAQRAAPGSRA